jgi:HAE1 family hydrophobic/amphiphilic exporter-1
MNIALKPFAERRLSADQIAIELRAKLRNIPGTAVTIVNQPIIRVGARGSRSNYQYTLKGLDQNELEAVSVRLLRAMQQDATFVGVNSDHDFASQSAQIEIDRPRAASLAIIPDQIETTLGAAFGGEQISQILRQSINTKLCGSCCPSTSAMPLHYSVFISPRPVERWSR